jgi:hypothetical protein
MADEEVFTFHVPALRKPSADGTKQTVVLGYSYQFEGGNLPHQGAAWEPLGAAPIRHFGKEVVGALENDGYCVRTVEIPRVDIPPERRELVREIAIAQAQKWAQGEELSIDDALAIKRRLDSRRQPTLSPQSAGNSSGVIKAFVSYKWIGKQGDPWVEKFASDLRRAGIDALLDKWEVKLGESFTEYMSARIAECDVVLFVITTQSVAAVEQATGSGGALKFEMQMSAAKAISGDGRLIGVYREGSRPPHYLRDRRYVDFRDDAAYQDALQELIADLKGSNRKPPLGPQTRVLTPTEQEIERLQAEYDSVVTDWYDANYTHMDDNEQDNSLRIQGCRQRMEDLEERLHALGAKPRRKPF